ncbi:hypothetical protein [Paenibacillus alkalitolerans]|uniref:hypothetical protein n=1 Tax=Paenibacillus alkalitolerans TaxID=2799335 RepID=UPI0018F43512|nr:hypothetical protein [Paenibacillus alkalitolerans]
MRRSKAWTGWIFIVIFSIVLAGCSQYKSTGGSGPDQDFLNAKWEQLTEQAKGQTVNLYMWGGSDSINKYIDEWAAPRLKKNRMLR